MEAIVTFGSERRGPTGLSWRLALAIAAWWLAVLGGMLWLWRYESRPGAANDPPAQWPSESAIHREGRPIVVMIAHPYCPCTRASVGELALLMASLSSRVDAVVLFSMPDGDVAGWAESDLWQSAAAIPGVSVVADRDGSEARRFRAATSGTVVAYDAEGDLLFAGGITGGRGHSGDNPGRARLTAALGGTGDALHESPVFGCAVEDAPEALASVGGIR